MTEDKRKDIDISILFRRKSGAVRGFQSRLAMLLFALGCKIEYHKIKRAYKKSLKRKDPLHQ
jgi:hypothetical protein